MPKTPTIAIVADDPALTASLHFALELEGYAVRGYRALSQLLREAPQPAPACLIVDQDSIEPGSSIAAPYLSLATFAGPVILMTSHPTAALLDVVRSAPRLRMVDKPLLGNTLSDAIRDLLPKAAGGAKPSTP